LCILSDQIRTSLSDIVKPVKVVSRLSKKRRRGGQSGHRKFSRQPFKPEQVDEVVEYELRDKDAEGLKPLDEWFVIQQVELPEKMYEVIEHRARREPAARLACAGANASGRYWPPAKSKSEMSLILSINLLLLTGVSKNIRC
jgi:hypothetical protein